MKRNEGIRKKNGLNMKKFSKRKVDKTKVQNNKKK